MYICIRNDIYLCHICVDYFFFSFSFSLIISLENRQTCFTTHALQYALFLDGNMHS